MIKKWISLILALCLVFCFVSCDTNGQTEGKTENADTETEMIIGRTAVIYNDTVFYHDEYERTIKKQNLNNVQSKGLPLYYDPLASAGENPFSRIGFYTLMIIDPVATEKNGGQPILYIYLEKYRSDGTGDDRSIVSFDTATNRMRVLKENVGSLESNFVLYGDYLVFAEKEKGGTKQRIHCITTDGKDVAVFENPENWGLSIKNIWNDKIYFCGTRDLYEAPLSLDSCSLVLKDVGTPVFFYDDYLYYRPIDTMALWRVSEDDYSAKELVQEKGAGMFQDGLVISRGKLREGTLNDISIYDPKTNTLELVYRGKDEDKENALMYMSFSKEYIVFMDDLKRCLVYYDIVAKKETIIPY